MAVVARMVEVLLLTGLRRSCRIIEEEYLRPIILIGIVLSSIRGKVPIKILRLNWLW